MDTTFLKCIKTHMLHNQVICKKGNTYRTISENDSQYVIIDDNGEELVIFKGKHTEEYYQIHGYLCEQHGIGYKGKCPTCAYLENPYKRSKKEQKGIRQFLRKHKR